MFIDQEGVEVHNYEAKEWRQYPAIFIQQALPIYYLDFDEPAKASGEISVIIKWIGDLDKVYINGKAFSSGNTQKKNFLSPPNGSQTHDLPDTGWTL